MTDTLRTGDNVFIPRLDNLFFVVEAVEPFNYSTGDSDTEFSSVATSANSGYVNIDYLEPDKDPIRIYQVWFGVKDGCTYKFKIPVGTDRWGIDEDKDVGYITNETSPYYAKNENYEFWLTHNTYPAIQASNATGSTVTPKVYFEGVKYTLKRLSAKPAIYRTIRVGGPDAP